MEYSKIKDFDKYKSVFDHKVAQLRRPQERQALVIFSTAKTQPNITITICYQENRLHAGWFEVLDLY